MRYKTALAALAGALIIAPAAAMAYTTTSDCGSVVRDNANGITATRARRRVTIINDHGVDTPSGGAHWLGGWRGSQRRSGIKVRPLPTASSWISRPPV